MPSAESIVHRFFPDVEKVKDATRAVTIEVTKRDTTSSTVKSHKACAMAVACKRALELDGVVISRRIAYLIKDNVATRYAVPESVTREVVAFDRGGVFEPGEYKLQKPRPYISLGTSGRARITGKGKKLGTRGDPHHATANIRAKLGHAAA